MHAGGVASKNPMWVYSMQISPLYILVLLCFVGVFVCLLVLLKLFFFLHLRSSCTCFLLFLLLLLLVPLLTPIVSFIVLGQT